MLWTKTRGQRHARGNGTRTTLTPKHERTQVTLAGHRGACFCGIILLVGTARGEVVVLLVYPTITSGAVGLSGQGMAALEAVRFSAPELKLS